MNPTQFMSRNLIFNTEFQNSNIPGNFQKFAGSLDIALELAIVNWFQYIGYLFHSFLVKELDFQYRISKFHHSWKLSEIFWNSGYHPGIGYFFLISTYRVFFHSSLVKELDFQCRISKFHNSWKLPKVSWKSGYRPGIGIWFPSLKLPSQFWHTEHQFNLIFATEFETWRMVG